jgi:hypothetical protein
MRKRHGRPWLRVGDPNEPVRWLAPDGFTVGPRREFTAGGWRVSPNEYFELAPRDELDSKLEYLERAVAFLRQLGEDLLHNNRAEMANAATANRPGHIHVTPLRTIDEDQAIAFIGAEAKRLPFEELLGHIAQVHICYRAELKAFCEKHGLKTHAAREREAREAAGRRQREEDEAIARRQQQRERAVRAEAAKFDDSPL